MENALNSVNAEQAPVVEGQQVEPVEGGKDAELAGQQTEQTTEPPVKTQETPEEKQEKPQQTPEENARYKALRLEEKQRAEQAAIDKEYAALAERYGLTRLDGSPIRTKADWDAYETERRQYDALIQKGEPEDAALLKVQLERLRAEKEQQEQAIRETARQQADFMDFLAYFKEVNKRDWTEADVIPPDVFVNARQKNIPLKYAYADYKLQERLKKEAEIETGKKTQEANAKNAATSPGSVTGGGAPSDDFITAEAFAANRSNPEWVRKNYEKIMKSRDKW